MKLFESQLLTAHCSLQTAHGQRLTVVIGKVVDWAIAVISGLESTKPSGLSAKEPLGDRKQLLHQPMKSEIEAIQSPEQAQKGWTPWQAPERPSEQRSRFPDKPA